MSLEVLEDNLVDQAILLKRDEPLYNGPEPLHIAGFVAKGISASAIISTVARLQRETESR